MAIHNKFSFHNFNVNKQVYTIDEFYGVDFSKYKLKVNPKHAIEMKNIIRRDNVNQKRLGWEEVIKVPNEEYFVYFSEELIKKTNDNKVNGVWTFYGEDNLEHTIAHIGCLLYEIKNIDKGSLVASYDMIATPVSEDGVLKKVAIELKNTKTQAFVGSNKLYILGGNDYFVLRFLSDGTITYYPLRNAEDNYIPTTTISIVFTDSLAQGRYPLDDINMLTQWRKNKLVTGTYREEDKVVRSTRYFEYMLDTNINAEKENDLNDFELTMETIEKVEE
jgi:hypothetical protein